MWAELWAVLSRAKLGYAAFGAETLTLLCQLSEDVKDPRGTAANGSEGVLGPPVSLYHQEGENQELMSRMTLKCQNSVAGSAQPQPLSSGVHGGSWMSLG